MIPCVVASERSSSVTSPPAYVTGEREDDDDDVLQRGELVAVVAHAAEEERRRRGVAESRLDLRLVAHVTASERAEEALRDGLHAQRVVERHHRAVDAPHGELRQQERHRVLHEVADRADLWWNGSTRRTGVPSVCFS